MNLDVLFAEMKKRKLRVSNLYEGTDKKWRCSLRKNDREVASVFGIGATAALALMDALELGFADTVSIQFSDLLG